MKEKDLKIDSFVKSCMQNTIGGSAKSNNQWYLECLNKAKIQKILKTYILVQKI